MFIDETNILELVSVGRRGHKVTLFIPVRPENPSLYKEFFQRIADGFCNQFNCKFNGELDVELNPHNESSMLVFHIKEYKHPEKHRSGRLGNYS